MAKTTIKATYDIEESARIGRESLERLKREKRPGEGARGGKMDVLAALKDEMAEMLRQGYTASQIADALSEGGLFTAQPKTIAEVAGVTRKGAARRTGTQRRRGDKPHEEVVEIENVRAINSPVVTVGTHEQGREMTSGKGAFEIKQDTDDL